MLSGPLISRDLQHVITFAYTSVCEIENDFSYNVVFWGARFMPTTCLLDLDSFEMQRKHVARQSYKENSAKIIFMKAILTKQLKITNRGLFSCLYKFISRKTNR